MIDSNSIYFIRLQHLAHTGICVLAAGDGHVAVFLNKAVKPGLYDDAEYPNYTGALAEAYGNACGKKDYLLNFASILNSTLSDVSAREHGRLGSFIITDSVGSGDQQSPYRNIYNTMTPDYSALSSAVTNTLSYNLTGFGGINIDIPEKDIADPKLFERWVAFAAYAPHARFKGTLKLLEDAKTLTAIKAFCAIRTGLAPYIYSCLCENVNYGTPVVRAMALEFAGDPAAQSSNTQYMLGSEPSVSSSSSLASLSLGL